jgi:HD-like signal output (HDOD) protein
MNSRSERAQAPKPVPTASDEAIDEGSPEGVDLVGVLDRIDGLPALPEFVTRMLTFADDPNVSSQDIARMVSDDQAMAAAVLRLVNAPFYGLGRRISSIQQAVLMLGQRTVRNLALSAVLVKSYGEPSRDRRFDRVRLWRHTVACAAGARFLSQRFGCNEPEDAFLAGLVHDMGIVVFDQFFHDGFRRVADMVIAMGSPLVDAEREMFGRDHAFAGRMLARRWNFPVPVIEAIGCHHDPARARVNPMLAAIVHLADWLEGATVNAPVARFLSIAGAASGAAGAGAPGLLPPDGPSGTAPGAPPPGGSAAPVPGAAAVPLDPFCQAGPLDPAALEVLGIGPGDLEELRLAVVAERRRTEALTSLLP